MNSLAKKKHFKLYKISHDWEGILNMCLQID